MSYFIESTVRDLLDSDTTKAIIEQHLPGFSSDPRIVMAQGMGLSTLAQFSNGLINEEALRKVDAALKALG
jgi:hypothetical protein